MTEQEETRLDREESASAEEFSRILKQYGLTEVQKGLLKARYMRPRKTTDTCPYQHFVKR